MKSNELAQWTTIQASAHYRPNEVVNRIVMSGSNSNPAGAAPNIMTYSGPQPSYTYVSTSIGDPSQKLSQSAARSSDAEILDYLTRSINESRRIIHRLMIAAYISAAMTFILAVAIFLR